MAAPSVFRMRNGIREKRCPKCREFYPHNKRYFYPRRNDDGDAEEVALNSWCRWCSCARAIRPHKPKVHKPKPSGYSALALLAAMGKWRFA